MRSCWTTGLVMSLAMCLSAQGADWPRFGGPNWDGSAPDVGINKDWTARRPKTLWKISLSDNGHAGVSVANGTVYIVDHRDDQDVVRAINVDTGKDVWEYSYADGAQEMHGFTMSTPLVEKGRVYVYSRMGKATCLDAKTGAMIWNRDTRADFDVTRNEFDHATSPAIVDGKVILFPGGRGAAVVALDAGTGKVLWHGAGDSVSGYASPVIATINAQTQIVAFVGDGLMGINPADGKVLWSFPWPTRKGQNSATPIVRGNTVLITSAWQMGSVLLDVTGNRPRVVWESKDMLSRFPTPVICQGRIYGTQDPGGKLVCLDAQTGKLLWNKSGWEFASALVVDGAVILQESKRGDLVMLDASADQYKELGRFRPLGGSECWTAPVMVDGKLLVRNTRTLACLDLR